MVGFSTVIKNATKHGTSAASRRCFSSTLLVESHLVGRIHPAYIQEENLRQGLKDSKSSSRNPIADHQVQFTSTTTSSSISASGSSASSTSPSRNSAPPETVYPVETRPFQWTPEQFLERDESTVEANVGRDGDKMAKYKKFWQGLSKSMDRGFRFDRIRGAPVSKRKSETDYRDQSDSWCSRPVQENPGRSIKSFQKNGKLDTSDYSLFSNTDAEFIKKLARPRRDNSQELAKESSSSSSANTVETLHEKSRSKSYPIQLTRKEQRTSERLDIPPEEFELDRYSAVSIGSVQITNAIMDKITRLVRDFGHKKDLERYGRYLIELTRSRTSVEIPKVLSSRFLPEHDAGRSPMDRIIQDPVYQAAVKGQEFAGEDLQNEDKNQLGGVEDADSGTSNKGRKVKTMSNLLRLARAHAEDSRHKLYQMFWSPQASIAYLAHRYPAAYASNIRVLHEINMRCQDFVPRSMLDYGSGPGPSVAAAFQVWHKSFDEVVCVDPSARMTQLGQYLLADARTEAARDPANFSIQWQSSLYDVSLTNGSRSFLGKHASSKYAAQKYDLVTVSYVQMEIRGQHSRDMLVRNLWNRLNPGGILVLIERGTPTGFRFMHHIREMFIEEIGVSKMHFVAPCSHEGMCPLAVTGRDWCHFGQKVARLHHRAYCKGSRAKTVEEEKFSFLAIRKSPGPRYKYSSEREAPTIAEKSYFWPRIVMPVIRSGKHSLIDVCSSGGNANYRFVDQDYMKNNPDLGNNKQDDPLRQTFDETNSRNGEEMSCRTGVSEVGNPTEFYETEGMEVTSETLITAKCEHASKCGTRCSPAGIGLGIGDESDIHGDAGMNPFASSTKSTSCRNFYSVPNGYFERLSCSKAKNHSLGYRFARQAHWSDLWRYPKRVVRPEARQYIPEESRAHLDRLAKKAGQAMGIKPVEDAEEDGDVFSADEASKLESDVFGKSFNSSARPRGSSGGKSASGVRILKKGTTSHIFNEDTYKKEKRDMEEHYG